MADIDVMSEDEKKEIKQMVSTMLLLSKEDRAILLSSALALRVRSDIEKSKAKE